MRRLLLLDVLANDSDEQASSALGGVYLQGADFRVWGGVQVSSPMKLGRRSSS